MRQNKEDGRRKTEDGRREEREAWQEQAAEFAADLGDFIDAWKQDTVAAAVALAQAPATGPCGPEPVGDREAPDPEWVRGTCPACGAPIVSNSYYIGGKGYILVWECWERLGEAPTCTYRRVL